MAQPEVDVAVVGAGPAGIVAARGLLRQGLRVTLIDPGLPPASRVESLPQNGIALATDLGLGPALSQAALGRASDMRLWWRDRPEVRDFRADGPMLLDRGRFHAALRGLLPQGCIRTARVGRMDAADDHVLLHMGQETLSARFVIDARGRAGQRGRRDGAALVALCFRGRGAVRGMLLESLATGWIWACGMPDGAVSGAMFQHASDLGGVPAREWADWLSPQLAGSALGLPRDLCAGPLVPAMLQAVVDPLAAPLILAVGDAALARDPVASHGLVHALRSGAQAAVAVATILDPGEAADAAAAFVRDRHDRAVATARTATGRGYADQTQHRTVFWSTGVSAPPQPTPAPAWPTLSRPLSLAPLRRAAVLDGHRIRWTDAIWLDHSAQAAPRLGPIQAARLAAVLGKPAPIAILSQRLEQVMDLALAQAILRQLLDEGALRDRSTPRTDQPSLSSA